MADDDSFFSYKTKELVISDDDEEDDDDSDDDLDDEEFVRNKKRKAPEPAAPGEARPAATTPHSSASTWCFCSTCGCITFLNDTLYLKLEHRLDSSHSSNEWGTSSSLNLLSPTSY